MNKLFYVLCIVILCWGCSSETEKPQNSRNNIVNVKDKVIEIEIENVLINNYALVFIMNDYLLISDYKSFDNQIYLFDKNSFNYLAGTAPRGPGPYEITLIGHIEPDETHQRFYVTDAGKQKIFGYVLDSVLANPQYRPEEKMKMNATFFPEKYQYVNDTLCIGIVWEVLSYSDYKPSVAKWNMETGEIITMPYEHPKIKKKRINFAVSMEHGIYVECYYYRDLMTICDLDGNLKYNIYGRNWDAPTPSFNSMYYYKKAKFIGDKIVAAYSGNKNFSDEELPTKFLVFDLNGDYIKTIETGYKMVDFCYDSDNNRIIMSLDDVIHFAYLELDGLI